jgi:hypothetical protein
MPRPVLISGAILIALAAGVPGAAFACQTRGPQGVEEQAAAAVAYEASLWDRSALVYVARITAIETDRSGLETVRLSPEAVLKGEGRPDALVLDRLPPLCTPPEMRFDALAGEVGEIFVLYARTPAPETFRDILSSVDPDTLSSGPARRALEAALRPDAVAEGTSE